MAQSKKLIFPLNMGGFSMIFHNDVNVYQRVHTYHHCSENLMQFWKLLIHRQGLVKNLKTWWKPGEFPQAGQSLKKTLVNFQYLVNTWWIHQAFTKETKDVLYTSKIHQKICENDAFYGEIWDFLGWIWWSKTWWISRWTFGDFPPGETFLSVLQQPHPKFCENVSSCLPTWTNKQLTRRS